MGLKDENAALEKEVAMLRAEHTLRIVSLE